MQIQKALYGSMAVATLAGIANAAVINKVGDISTSEVWTANNTYNLTGQVYIKNGATLTIEPGTVIASTPTANGSGSLAITRGSKIIAQGNQGAPIIFTSTADVATWVAGNPTTGTWRAPGQRMGQRHDHGRRLHVQHQDFRQQLGDFQR